MKGNKTSDIILTKCRSQVHFHSTFLDVINSHNEQDKVLIYHLEISICLIQQWLTKRKDVNCCFKHLTEYTYLNQIFYNYIKLSNNGIMEKGFFPFTFYTICPVSPCD